MPVQRLLPRASPEGQKLDAVQQFAMNCVQQPKTAGADEGSGTAAGGPPCEQVPLRTAPAELAREAAEEYFTK